MRYTFNMPSRKETLTVVGITALFLLLTAVCLGLRPEHLLMAFIFLALFFAGIPTRKLAVALLPFFIFGISYDWMRVFPNYEVNPIDVAGIYNLEKSWFGINDNGNLLIPCEYFTLHNWKFADFMAGIFYLCWVPVPIAFGIYLYLKKERSLYLRFAMVFLFVNLIGFAGYYIHPAGLSVFQSIYGRNANVFAAVPSLHAAYMVIPLYYAIVRKSSKMLIALFAIILVGIWCTAVYSSHHYIIDVLLGIFCALLGIFVFEKGLMKIGGFKRFFERYYNYIK